MLLPPARVADSGEASAAARRGASDDSLAARTGLSRPSEQGGGSYAEQNDASLFALDGMTWAVGASYVTGPWGFSVEYFNGENQDNENSSFDESFEEFEVAGSYKLATGVKLFAFAAYVDFDEDVSNAQDVDGFIIGTGVNLSF